LKRRIAQSQLLRLLPQWKLNASLEPIAEQGFCSAIRVGRDGVELRC
jgi:hypothetical protein